MASLGPLRLSLYHNKPKTQMQFLLAMRTGVVYLTCAQSARSFRFTIAWRFDTLAQGSSVWRHKASFFLTVRKGLSSENKINYCMPVAKVYGWLSSAMWANQHFRGASVMSAAFVAFNICNPRFC